MNGLVRLFDDRLQPRRELAPGPGASHGPMVGAHTARRFGELIGDVPQRGRRSQSARVLDRVGGELSRPVLEGVYPVVHPGESVCKADAHWLDSEATESPPTVRRFCNGRRRWNWQKAHSVIQSFAHSLNPLIR
ncbi:MAG TPA: hypothetical protein VMM93_03060 [Vicinamibacterales bacterium]|nr:hypothetical protein [Vicinamibacterales bacterium]